MHAAAFEAFGPPENLVPTERPDPAPRDGWTVVELDAAALNWHDCLVRQGQYGFVPLPHVPGADGSGRRRDTGEPVIVLPSLHWGGQERAPGPDWQILGDQEEGTYAELVSVPEANVLPRPAGWSAVEAAALPLAGLTAHRALFARGGLRRGETVLVPGAGGGVATFAIGLARMAGARVLVTSSSRAKIDRAKELGAEDGVLYTDADWTAQVRELTGGVGVDLVFDSTGVWQDALDTLCRGGRVVTFGATSEATTTVDVRRFYFGQWSILGTTMGSPADFTGLLDLLGEEPTWRPVVDRVLPLDRAGEAHAVMERREHTGKIVLEIT